MGFLLSTSACATAQWSCTVINPPGATGSRGENFGDGSELGYAVFGGADHAGIWSGPANSWTDLNPPGAAYSLASREVAGVIVGTVSWYSNSAHAAIWNGAANPPIDLNPAGMAGSQAFAMSQGVECGYVFDGKSVRACTWTGTASSCTVLEPTGTQSYAFDILNGVEAGALALSVGQPFHAVLWSGSTGSYVDLEPAAANGSEALSLDGQQECGYATVNGVARASLWSGSSASWVNLDPTGSTQSWAAAVKDGVEVGNARFNGVIHAGYWTGSASSWVDLSGFVPSGFSNTRAEDIWQANGRTFIVGYGTNTMTGQDQALLWASPTPEPVSVLLVGAGALGLTIRRRAR